MSSPRHIWWPYAKGMVRQYPVLCERLRVLRCPKTTADYSGMPHGGAPGSQTETLALRELSKTEMAELEAVHKAVRATLRKKGGEDRMKLIHMVYWARSKNEACTVAEAAIKIPCDYSTARRWHAEFMYTVAQFRGLLD